MLVGDCFFFFFFLSIFISPVQVIWYHDGRPVKESEDFQLLFKGDKCSLLIKEVYVEDGGEYKVVAINSAGETSSSCKLTVQGKN